MSNDKKLSSIEWLLQEALEWDVDRTDNSQFIKFPSGAIEKAKAMHKREIENAHYQGQSDEKDYWNIGDKCMIRFQGKCMEYYNETFGGNKL